MDKRYVYLDWNVFKTFETHNTQSNEFTNALKKLGCYIPFSDAHIQDLMSSIGSYNNMHHKYIHDDIELIISVSNKNFILYENCRFFFKENIEPFHILKQFYDKKIEQAKNPPKINGPDIEPMSIDMSNISEDHPFFSYLKINNGFMDSKVIDEFSNTNLFKMFDDQNTYRNFRHFVQLLDSPKMLEALKNNAPAIYKKRKVFIKLMSETNLETLEAKYLDAMRDFIAFSGRNFDHLPFAEKFMVSYLLSDNFKLLQESLKPSGKNKLHNIRIDFLHSFYAINAKYYITQDKSTRKKTKFIYRLFDIPTKIMTINEFLDEVY